MAHELDWSDSLGRHTAFSVRATMWHRLGEVLEQAPTFDDAIRLAGADYMVETRPLMYQTPNGPTFAEGHSAVVRTDSDAVLGVVSGRYTCIPNAVQFDPLRALVDEGLATIETGGVIRGGRHAWMLARLTIQDDQRTGDRINPYVLSTTRHDGSGAAQFALTAVRVVCANTLTTATQSGSNHFRFRIRHTGDAAAKVSIRARAMFARLGADFERAGDLWARMRSLVLTREQFVTSVLDTLAPLPQADSVMTKGGFDRAHARAANVRDRLSALWTNGAGHAGDHSAWEAWNAGIELIDHESDILRRSSGSRVEAEISGWAGQAKTDTLTAILAVGGMRP